MENETNNENEIGAGNENRGMNAKQLGAAIGLGILVSIIFVSIGLAFSSGSLGQTGLASNSPVVSPAVVATGPVKEFALSISGGVYQPNPITVNKGDTVRLVADVNSIRGCYSTVVISKFGVRKTVKAGDNIIEFVASEAGTFQVTCGMGMAGGSIVVKDTNGTVPATTDVGQAKQGSCGSGGGGCGCGGG